MEKDMIFFGDNGLTNTSANHIANMAKEMYTIIEKELNNTCFFTTTVSALNSEVVKVVSNGKDNKFLNGVESKLHDIAELKSLIAWLREAIKARESLKNDIHDVTLTKYCEMRGVAIPEREQIEKPVLGPVMTEGDYFATLSLAERNRYYELETKVAVLGKYIHNDGSLSKGRQLLVDKMESPTDIVHDVTPLVYEYKPTVSIADIDELFFHLQATYREYQAELNGMKHSCDLACEASRVNRDTEYTKAYAEYMAKDQAAADEYNKKIEKSMQEWKLWETKEIERISNLKIVIPNNLKRIYEKVNNIGKK